LPSLAKYAFFDVFFGWLNRSFVIACEAPLNCRKDACRKHKQRYHQESDRRCNGRRNREACHEPPIQHRTIRDEKSRQMCAHRIPWRLTVPLRDAESTLSSRPSPLPRAFHPSLRPSSTLAMTRDVPGACDSRKRRSRWTNREGEDTQDIRFFVGGRTMACGVLCECLNLRVN
jgi:hypothetical protein